MEQTKPEGSPSQEESKEDRSSSLTASQFAEMNLSEKQRKMLLEVDVNMELRKRLWEGQIPLKITLDINDVSHLSKPRSLYVMIPRQNYLFFILDEVKQTFDEFGPADKLTAYNEMWFEGPHAKPLRWSVPIGAQFDAIAGVQGRQKDLPWELVFHYKGFPDAFKEEKELLTMQNYFKFHFFSALKESQVMRSGSASEILSAQSAKETQKMMEGLTTHSFDQFWEINQVLCDRPLADSKKYAVRIVSNHCSTFIQPHLLVKQNEESKQAEDTEVGEVLVQAFPGLFEHEVGEDMETSVVPKLPNMSVLCQGVPVDMKTPLHWMQVNLGCLDNFLYLSFHFN